MSQNHITQFGRVGFDPLKIPQVSIGDGGIESGESFAKSLDRVVSRNADDDRQQDADLDRDAETSTDDAGRHGGADSDRNIRDTRGADDSHSEASDGAIDADASNAAQTYPLGEAVAGRRNDKTGKGPATASPYLSQTGHGDTKTTGKADTDAALDTAATFAGSALAGALQASHGNAASQNAAAQANSSHASVTATAGLASSASAASGGASALAGLESSASAKARSSSEAPAAGYRSGAPVLDTATLRLAETQRDSVFRQVSMRLHQGGGEMHVFLDPPELGELEIRMVVERGEATKLTVVAERPEVAWLMQRHIAELRTQLEAQGMQVGDAEILTRDEQNAQRGTRDADGSQSRNSSDSGDASDAAATSPLSSFDQAPRGYVTADGLEVWI